MAQKDCSSNRKTIAVIGFRSVASVSRGPAFSAEIHFQRGRPPGPPDTGAFKAMI
jgi:hypothetical protein